MSFFFFSSAFNTIVPTILRDKQEYTGVDQHHVDPGLRGKVVHTAISM